MIKKEEPEEKELEKIISETDESANNDSMLKTEDIPEEATIFFNQDYYNDDDDFEWKEEPLVEIHDDSPDSDGKRILY